MVPTSTTFHQHVDDIRAVKTRTDFCHEKHACYLSDNKNIAKTSCDEVLTPVEDICAGGGAWGARAQALSTILKLQSPFELLGCCRYPGVVRIKETKKTLDNDGIVQEIYGHIICSTVRAPEPDS